jgi:hypothetical protein
MARSSFLVVLGLVLGPACGSDSKSTPDAKPTFDAKASTVMKVNCPATPDATVTTPGFNYSITYKTGNSIPVNGIVHFTMEAAHDADSGTNGASDGQFHVGFGGDECQQFTAAGMFPFFCSAHGFTGSLTVQ